MIPINYEKILSLAASESVSAYLVNGKHANSIRLKYGSSGIWLPYDPSYDSASSDSPLLCLILKHFSLEYSLLSSGFLVFLAATSQSASPSVKRDYQSRRKTLDTVVRFLDYLFFDFQNLISEGSSLHLTSLFDSRIVFKLGPSFYEWTSGHTTSSLAEFASSLTDNGKTFHCYHRFKATPDSETDTWHPILPLSCIVNLEKPELILEGMIVGTV